MCILPMLERGEGVQEVIAAMTLYVYVYITNVREGGGSPGGYSSNVPVCVYYQC